MKIIMKTIAQIFMIALLGAGAYLSPMHSLGSRPGGFGYSYSSAGPGAFSPNELDGVIRAAEEAICPIAQELRRQVHIGAFDVDEMQSVFRQWYDDFLKCLQPLVQESRLNDAKNYYVRKRGFLSVGQSTSAIDAEEKAYREKYNKAVILNNTALIFKKYKPKFEGTNLEESLTRFKEESQNIFRDLDYAKVPFRTEIDDEMRYFAWKSGKFVFVDAPVKVVSAATDIVAGPYNTFKAVGVTTALLASVLPFYHDFLIKKDEHERFYPDTPYTLKMYFQKVFGTKTKVFKVLRQKRMFGVYIALVMLVVPHIKSAIESAMRPQVASS